MPKIRRCGCRSAATRWSASRPRTPMSPRRSRHGERSRPRRITIKREGMIPDSGRGNSMRRGSHLKLARRSGDAPARAGNVLRRNRDRLLEAHQLPVVAIVAEHKTGFARQADHGGVGAQRIAEQAGGAERGGAAFEILQERRADAVSLPAIVDRQAEFETPAVNMERIARLADDGLEAIDRHGSDNSET